MSVLGTQALGSNPFGGSGSTNFLNAGLQIIIGPKDVTDITLWESSNLEEELNGRDQLSFTIKSTPAYIPKIGEEVKVLFRSGTIFLGSIHERQVEFLYTPQQISLLIQISCVDINAIADRRFVSEVYENLLCGEIVGVMAAKYLLFEGVSLGNVHPGPRISKVVFNRISFAECMNKLCEQAGFYWQIDKKRFLSFFPRSVSPAPFTVTEANAVFRNIKGTISRNQYRNVQYIDGGKGLTDARTEAFRGDGTVKTFTTEYKISTQPTITLNGGEETVGIRGVETGKGWYWAKGENSIGQDAGYQTLISTDLLLVTYRGEFNLVNVIEDSQAIFERQTIEGGTGRYEHLVVDTALDGQDLIQEKGLSLLRRYSTLDDTATFDVYQEGLQIGQNVTLDVASCELQGAFLITNMRTSFVTPTMRMFTVTVTNGEIKNKFQDFFAGFLGSARPGSISAGDILQEVNSNIDPVGVTDSITATLVSVVSDEFGTGEVGTSEFGA
jgi:hypothetical protein